LALLGMALWQWRWAQGEGELASDEQANTVKAMSPFNLGTALAFGTYLATIAVLVPAAKAWLGSSGIYMLSAVSGLADVDAIVISLAHMHRTGGILTVATGWALGFATLANIVSKASIAWTTAGSRVGLAVAVANVLALGVAGLALWGLV